MKELYPLYGIISVLNTPFRLDKTIDISALKTNVRLALQSGVAGFLVPALASEVCKLSEYERIKMVEAVLQESDNKVIIIGGAGESDPVKAKKILKAYSSIGCRNVLFQIPFHDEVQFRHHFSTLAETDSDMIMLQDWDSSGYGLPDDLIFELFQDFEKFRCLKIETVPAGPKYSRIIELTQGRLNVSGGWAVTQMTEGLRRGVHAFMPTGMHLIYCEIYRLWTAGKEDEAESLFHKILPVLTFSNQHLDISVHFFKRLLFRQGIYPTDLTRQPILEFDLVHQTIADKLIDYIVEIENELLKNRESIDES